MQSAHVFLGLGGGAENQLSSSKLVELKRSCLSNKNRFIKEVERRSDVFFLPRYGVSGGGCGLNTSFQGSCRESGLSQTLIDSPRGNASLAFGTSAHDNNGVVVLFFIRLLQFLGICCSMDLGIGEMDLRWIVFTLFLNFQLNYVSPSSYDLFKGSAYNGVVHRHRNRYVLFCFVTFCCKVLKTVKSRGILDSAFHKVRLIARSIQLLLILMTAIFSTFYGHFELNTKVLSAYF